MSRTDLLNLLKEMLNHIPLESLSMEVEIGHVCSALDFISYIGVWNIELYFLWKQTSSITHVPLVYLTHPQNLCEVCALSTFYS